MHLASSAPVEQSAPRMFTIRTRPDPNGHVVMVGKPSRKRASTFINIPMCEETRRQLNERFIGSISMSTSALIEWALEELKRQGVALEVLSQK